MRTTFFLSYSRANKRAADALVSGLQSNGVAIWSDSGIKPGERWIDRLADELERSSGFLVLVGQDGIDKWVKIEVSYALNRQVTDGGRYPIVPMLMPDVEPAALPPFLRPLQIFELNEDPSQSKPDTFATLAEHLNNELRKNSESFTVRRGGDAATRPSSTVRPRIGPTLWLLLCLAVLVSAGVWYWLGSSRPDPILSYPRDDGLIASFVTGPGGPPRNVFGMHFSLFSDSAWNLGSKVWYRRVDEADKPGEGFLRVYYQLDSVTEREPYVGVYTTFSPRATQYDVSSFRRLKVRMRLGQPPESPIRVALFLYSANVTNWENGTPTYQIEPQDLRQEWTEVSPLFDDFGPPITSTESTQSTRLDPTRVLRVGILIAGTPMNSAHGHIDVDEIRFEP